jgi:dienelactone hydrolase
VRHSYTNPQADEFSNKFELPALKYDAEADKRAWQSMQEFFDRVFGK